MTKNEEIERMRERKRGKKYAADEINKYADTPRYFSVTVVAILAILMKYLIEIPGTEPE